MFEQTLPRKPKVMATLSALEVENAKQLATVVHAQGYELGLVLAATAHALQRASSLRSPGAHVALDACHCEVQVEFSIPQLAEEEELRQVLASIWAERHPEGWHLVATNILH